MGGRVELRNFDVVVSNMNALSEKLKQQAQESADYASIVLQEKAKEYAALTDYSLAELAAWNSSMLTDGMRHSVQHVGAYSAKMPEDSGPTADQFVHIQSGTLYANIERKVIIQGDRIIAAVGVEESMVPYIGYLINGNSKMRARDFLGHALQDVKETMIKILKSGISVGGSSRGGNVR